MYRLIISQHGIKLQHLTVDIKSKQTLDIINIMWIYCLDGI